MSTLKGAYWDSLYKKARKEDNKELVELMNDIEKSVDTEILKQIKEGKLYTAIAECKRAASKS
ncbi:hypothetical protein [Bacillus mycoides]|uniref:hypothetical protein n=1 Tax=Bacillus mycoides TaxID=1405 RepID=UPI002E1A6445|nr:hypothetical protein [Bacillus mycoides]